MGKSRCSVEAEGIPICPSPQKLFKWRPTWPQCTPYGPNAPHCPTKRFPQRTSTACDSDPLASAFEVLNTLQHPCKRVRSRVRSDGMLLYFRYGTSPGGLPSTSYDGHVFWDQETWFYPPLAMQHPAIARAITSYRLRMLPEGRRLAATTGQANCSVLCTTLLSLTLSLSLAYTPTLALSLSLAYTYTLSLSHTHTHTSHTRARTQCT